MSSRQQKRKTLARSSSPRHHASNNHKASSASVFSTMTTPDMQANIEAVSTFRSRFTTWFLLAHNGSIVLLEFRIKILPTSNTISDTYLWVFYVVSTFSSLVSWLISSFNVFMVRTLLNTPRSKLRFPTFMVVLLEFVTKVYSFDLVYVT